MRLLPHAFTPHPFSPWHGWSSGAGRQPDICHAKHPVDIQSKAFRRLRVSLGYDDDRLVFHSIRATVITMLERAGVPEHITQDIVGHERATLTGQTYSMKSIMGARAEAIAKLAY